MRNRGGYISLVEVLVSITIVSLLMGGFTLIFQRTWEYQSFALEQSQSILSITQTISQLEEKLRMARQGDDGSFAIKSGNDFNLVVYSDDDKDGVAERIHYFLDKDNDQLKKGITKPAGSPLAYPASDQTISVVASYIMNTDAQPLFYYYNKQYPNDLINNPLAVPITPTDVRLIGINIWVNIKPIKAPDNINIRSMVEMRNLNENQ